MEFLEICVSIPAGGGAIFGRAGKGEIQVGVVRRNIVSRTRCLGWIFGGDVVALALDITCFTIPTARYHPQQLAVKSSCW